jgi:site-specific DNA-methyltransferase (adenine-specific)
MSADYIDETIREFARVLAPSGYLMRWVDKFVLCEGHHLRIPPKLLKIVDLIVTDNAKLGMGYRSRASGDLLLILQKAPIKAKTTRRDHGIPDRWIEKVDRKLHPHMKPIGLITRLIAATTEPDDLVIDPAAGSFNVLHACQQLGRGFIGCDIAYEAHNHVPAHRS